MAKSPHFSLFLFKIASRCNLACDYCYVYFHGDQRWRKQPKFFSLELAHTLGRRLAEHAQAHGLATVDVVLHGGEPFLLGIPQLEAVINAIKQSAGSLQLKFSAQTNATLLTSVVLDWCLKNQLRLSVSIDGPRAAQERHRRDHAGKSAFDATERGMKLLSSEQYQKLFAGILCVVDLRNDPVEVYEYLKQFSPPILDFLLPLGNHDNLPYQKGNFEDSPYADWLLQIFEKWYQESPQTIIIRKFRELIGLTLGICCGSEELGGLANDFIVIETNGDIEATDSLKTTFSGATDLGLNIADHSFDEVLQAKKFTNLLQSATEYSKECMTCPIFFKCGAGHLPTRYSKENGFANPSVYCSDIKKLFDVIQSRLHSN